MRHVSGLLAPLLATASLVAQSAPPAPSPDPQLRYDVVSIKPHPANLPGGGGRISPDGTRVRNYQTIESILAGAYPSESGEYIGLPDWARRERYDIITKEPAGIPGNRASRLHATFNRVMMRNMLADRLKLQAHDETRDEQTFALTLARDDRKLGPNLKPRPDCIAEAQAARTARGGAPPPAPPAALPSDSEIMRGCGGRIGPGLLMIGGTPLAQFAQQLRGYVGRFVEDRTGLDGWYSIDLTFTPSPTVSTNGAALDPAAPAEIFTALQEQLGLKLVPSRRQLQVVVIDHIERPSEN